MEVVYPSGWHQEYGAKTLASAQRILPDLLELFHVRSLVEVGCGNAHWASVAERAGSDVAVIDGPWNNQSQLLVGAEKFLAADLGLPLVLPRRYDMALCLEVAEHVRAESADTLVQSLVDAADVIVFGAAIPLQGGYGHINEQWPSWWRAKFLAKGFEPFDLVRPRHWNDSAIHYWYRQNTFVYVRRSNAAAGSIARAAEANLGGGKSLFDAVHPEKYREMASYESIAMRRLLRQLPRWLARRIRKQPAALPGGAHSHS